MLGSRHYVAHPIRHLHQHVAVFNLEMLGRPDDIEAGTGWITGHRVSDFGDMVATGAKAVGVRLGEHPRFSRMLFAASDNISFAKEGVIAHSISAGSLHDDYHKPTDEPGKIDYEHMARVVNGLLHGSHALAMGGARPRWKEDTSYAEKAKALAVSFAAQETAEPKR